MFSDLERQLDLEARHLRVLAAVCEHQPIGIYRIARKTGQPKHRVRYSYQQLIETGLIRPSNQGAVLGEEADRRMEEYVDRLETVGERIERLRSDAPLVS